MTKRILDTSSSLAIFCGLGVLGFTVGFLSGSTGPDSTVLAAVLPALLSVLGTAAAAALLLKEVPSRKELLITGGIGITVFAAILLLGSHIGSRHNALYHEAAYTRAYITDQERHYDRLWLDLKHHHQRLEQCLKFEIRFNVNRQKLELPPLTHDQVCPSHVTSIPPTRRAE